MNELLSDLCGSPFWNSSLSWHTDDPHFTPCFEKTILAWLPCLFLAVASPFDVVTTVRRVPANIPWNSFSLTKMIVCVVIVATELAECGALLRARTEDIPHIFLLTSLLRILSTFYCLILMKLHRLKGVRTSGVLFTFWLLQTSLGIIQFRTELNKFINGETRIFSVFYFFCYFCFIAMLLLNFFADLNPAITAETNNPWPEKASSFPSRMTFSWFTSLVVLGFKRPLTNVDLWDLSSSDSSHALVPRFGKFWNRWKKSGSGSTSVLKVLFSMFGSGCIVAALQKLCQDLLAFVSPQMLKLLIDFVQGDDPQWRGFLYAGIILVGASLQTLLSAQHFNRMTRIGLQIKTCLLSAVYEKSLRLSNAARQETSTGQLVNLIAVDAQSFVEITPYLNTLWSAPLQILLALYFLWELLGWSILAGVATTLLMIPVNGFLTRRITAVQIQQLKHKDERAKIMNDILSGIKVLKLYAWETSFEKMVLNIRGKEAKQMKRAAYLNAFAYFIWASTSFLATASTFIVYVLSSPHHVLDASKAFVAISLFNLIRFPTSLLPMVIVAFAEMRVSVERIETFLNSDELNQEASDRNSKQDSEYSAVMENGTFQWSPNSQTLSNLNIKIKPRSLVAILGPTGSGKSSLVSAFLGDMDKLSGRVGVKGSIAYVPQTAWIQNASLRDNILFGNHFNKSYYRQVLNACALASDLRSLPSGDFTEIGDKGVTLSGGQKQRISLARAVYCDADVYFLDDPLSAVDSHVGKHIFDEVIGPKGVLRDKTRILVTHAVNHLHEVDLIVLLKDGSIVEMGTYSEMQNSQILLNLKEQENLKECELSQDIPSGDVKEDVIRAESLESLGEAGRAKKEQEDEENTQSGSVKWTVYAHYLKSINPWIILVVLVMSTLFQGFSISSNYWLALWSTDETLLVNHTQNTRQRDTYVGIYGCLGFAQILSTFFVSLAIQYGALQASVTLHDALIRSTLRAKLTFFDLTPVGRIMNRFSRDVDQLDSALPSTLRGWLGCLFAVMGTVFVICFSTPIFIVVFIPIAVIYHFFQSFYVATSRQLKRLEASSRSPMYSHFMESMDGASTLRAYNVLERFIKEFKRKIDFNQKCSYSEAVADRWLSVRLETVGNFIVFFSGLFAVVGRETVTPGLVGLSVSYALQITEVLNWLVRMTAEFKTNIVAVERVKEYTDIDQEAPWEIKRKSTESDWPSLGKLEFKNFSLRYRPGLNLVLRDLNFTVGNGEKVGIVGRTGAGKSSLTLAVFRIVEPETGQILIDGVDIAQLGLSELRSRLTIIPQDPTLFSGSLRMNLDPFERYTDEEIWRSIESAHLKTFVDDLPAKLQFDLTNGGDNLSLGQRQLLCLARALLRKSKVLILDEATAAVDLETDSLVQKTIRKEFASCTVLTIAHRLNSILDCNRVLVLDNGEAREFDSPGNLLKQEKSIFFSLAKDAGVL